MMYINAEIIRYHRIMDVSDLIISDQIIFYVHAVISVWNIKVTLKKKTHYQFI